jgi:hypothetical protein
VTVTDAPPVITSFSANPSTIKNGATTTLTWATSHADTCTASGGWSGSEPTSGSFLTGDLTKNTTFTLTCTSPGGSAQQSTTVTVSAPAPSVTLSASPQTVSSGGTTVLTWTSTNTTSCAASWTTSDATAGQQTSAALTATTTFSITCSNGAGSTAQGSVPVTVTPATTGTATLTWAAPTENTNGTPVTATELTGYIITYGNSASALTHSVSVQGGTTTTYQVTGLTTGTWYFAVAAVAADGTTSTPSTVGSKTI